MRATLVRFATTLLAISGLTGIVRAATLEAPVTLNMTISVTGEETQRTTAAGTDHRAKLTVFKFTNRDYLDILVNEGVISSKTGWRLVARWTSGDLPDNYGFYLVKAGSAPIALESDDEGGFGIDFGTFAEGYNERKKNSAWVSGSGTIKFATVFHMESEGDTFQLGGVGSGSYAITSKVKGEAPTRNLNSLKLTLLGGVISGDLEGVVEMTFVIGAPKVISSSPVPVTEFFSGSTEAFRSDSDRDRSIDITIIAPSS
jgi:hypothetical protein